MVELLGSLNVWRRQIDRSLPYKLDGENLFIVTAPSSSMAWT